MNPDFTHERTASASDTSGEQDVTIRVNVRAMLPPGLEQPGDMIGRYKLLEPLGEGGFGSVWRAEQSEPIHREVALKVIKAGMDSREIIARFAAERQALAMMDHPNIAAVLDAGTTDSGRPFFAMELVKGVPLTEFCDAKKLTIRQRLELFIPVCQAVQHAHQKAILHRDLKPSNILVVEVDGKPVPKVIDFGIAKALGGAEEQAFEACLARTQAGMIIGTPQYMSPEQAGAEPDLDTRSDIYTLGVILYELLVGDTPLGREQMRKAAKDEIMRLVREADAKRPSSQLLPFTEDTQNAAQHRQSDTKRLTHALRGDLDWIVLKALEKDRNRRYETANSLAADIVRHLHSEPVEAGPPSAAYRLRKFVRRNQLAVGAGVTMLFLLMAGVAVSTWQAVRATRQTNRAVAAEALAMDRLKQVAAEKKRADEEAAVAETVNAFLQNDLLLQASSHAQANRQHKPNPNLTVREALDRAAMRIENRFQNQPLVEAAIRKTIGQAYCDLGEAESALHQLREAVNIYSKVLGPEHTNTLSSRNDLGIALVAQGNYAEAEVEQRTVLTIRERLLGSGHPDTLLSRSNLASSLGYQGKNAEAEAEHRAVCAIFERTLGPEHPDTLVSRGNLAFMLKAQGKYAEAKAEYRANVALRERVLGPEHPDTLVGRSGLGSTLWALGEFAEAEAEHRAVLAIRVRVLGPEHPDTLTTRHNLAVALAAQKKTAEATAENRTVFEVRTRELGPEHPDTLSSRHSLATTLQSQGKNAEAEVEHRAVLAIRERVLGVNHRDVFLSCYCLGPCLRAQGKLGEALEFMRRAEAGWTKGLGPQHPYAKGAKTYRERFEAEIKMK